MDTHPANIRQLIDKTARSQEEAAFRGVLQFSERNTLVPAVFAEAGADAKNTQVVININTVTEHQIGRLSRQTVPGMLMIRHRPSCWRKEQVGRLLNVLASVFVQIPVQH